MSTPHAPQGPSSGVTRGRRTLLLVAALFFLPLAISFALYYGGFDWRPSGSTAKGDLLEPARPLPQIALPVLDGNETAPTFLQDKWSWIYIGDGACDARCRDALYLTRQSWIALNKDMDRVQRVFLVSGGTPDAAFLSAEHRDLIVARMDGEAAQPLLAMFPVYDGLAPASAGRIYLVDPHGNLLLSYSPASAVKAPLEDLKRLLRLSHIG